MKQIKQWGRTLLMLALVIGLLWPTTAALADTKNSRCNFYVNEELRATVTVPVATKWPEAKDLFEKELRDGEKVTKWERKNFIKMPLTDSFEFNSWIEDYHIYATVEGTVTEPQQGSSQYVVTLLGDSKTAMVTPKQAKTGEKVTVEAAQLPGKEFVEWKLHKGITAEKFGDVKQPKVTFSMPNNEVVLEAVFRETTPADDHLITDLSLEDLIAPMTGEKATLGHRVPVGAHYRIVNEKDSGWTDTVYNDMLKEGDVFKPFQVYKLTVYLQAEEGYTFAKDADAITKDFAKDPAKRIYHTRCTTVQDGKKFKFVIQFVTTNKEKAAEKPTDPTPKPQEPQQDPDPSQATEDKIYHFAEGTAVQWKKGSKEGLTLTVDGVNMTGLQLYEKREETEQPPVELEQELYTKQEKAGATVIVISPKHLQNLSEHKTYTVLADFLDGFGKIELTIQKGDTQPQPKARWQQLTDGRWVYLKADGSRLKSAWKGDYYLKADGIMADNEWIYDQQLQAHYFLKKGGLCTYNAWRGEYYLQGNGKMATSKWIYDRQYKAWYYVKADGRYARNEWKGEYYLGKHGNMIVSDWIYDSHFKAWYYLMKDGRYARNTIIDGRHKVGRDGKYIP